MKAMASMLLLSTTKLKPHLFSSSNPKSLFSTIKMSSSYSPHRQIIEHLVLFKAKPDSDPDKIESMISNLNGLNSLHQVLHISAGAIARTRSSPVPFTHILHSRYDSVESLDAYSTHPRHVGVVSDFAKPVVEDIMAVDWVSGDFTGPVEVRPGSGMRINLLKLKEGVGESEKNEILGVIGGIKEKFGGIEQLSYGENFSPARAKGFSIGSIAVVPGLGELEGLNSDGANEEKEKVRGFIDSVIVLDYLVPQLQNP